MYKKIHKRLVPSWSRAHGSWHWDRWNHWLGLQATHWSRGRKDLHGVEIFVLSINISKVWQHHLLKLCKLCKQEVHFKLIYMQNSMSCKDTKHRDFSLTDRAHDVQHSAEGTAKEQRWQAGVLNLIFFHLDSTCPLPFMIIKPIFIEKLYREDCHIKLPQNVLPPANSTFAEKGRDNVKW